MSVIAETILSIGQYLWIEWKPTDKWRLNIGTGSMPKGKNSYGVGRPIVPALLLSKGSKIGNTSSREYRSLITIKREVVRFYSSDNKNSLDTYPGLLALSELRLEFQQHKQVKNVYNLLLNEDLFITAHKKISKNKGAMTKGIDSETLDEYSMNIIRDTILQLKNHSFQFKPSRREYIPKANGKLRPLGIPSPRDKVVQQIMVMILEAIFENSIFLECSHGFRPNKGCHTALKSVSRWMAIDWFIEGDIKSYFDTIDHQTLANLIFSKIKDQQFLDLYWKAVRAGYVEMKLNKKIDSLVGTPQGSIISPILANIYLHELDELMTEKIKESNSSGNTSKPFKPYLQLHSKIHNLYRKKNKGITLTPLQESNLKTWITERGSLPSSIKGPGYRLYYVRYADDFLIGVNGTQQLTLTIKEEINKFLYEKLKLTMSLDKTKITSSSSKDDKKVLFLGTEIYRPTSRNHNQPIIQNTVKNRIVSRRIPATKLALLIPVKKLVEKLANQQFCLIKDYNQGQITPMGKPSWINLDLKEILFKYNSTLQGIFNYYSFASNRCRLQFIQFILYHSCAKLFGRKLKLNSRKVVFSKFGSKLIVKTKTKNYSFKLYKSFKATGKFLINPSYPLDSVYYGLRTKSTLGSCCTICSSIDNIEMHHVKALKSKTSGFMNVMRAMNRKQIPVCKSCHVKIHAGIYSGISLKKLPSKKD